MYTLRKRMVQLLFILFAAVMTVAGCASDKGVLLHIAMQCIDTASPDYCTRCRYPRAESVCGAGLGCKETTTVWEETRGFAVISDIKMCGCPSDFVHGLVIPRTPVTGVEDPRKPDDIWTVAWSAAQKRINDESTVALVVNPARLRTQDQLHVHIVRLERDTGKRLRRDKSARVRSLNLVWKAAAEKARALHMQDYGLLVVREQEGDFSVFVAEQSPEKVYTQWECK